VAINSGFSPIRAVSPRVAIQLAEADLQVYPVLSITGSVGSIYQVQYVNSLTAADSWLPLANLVLTNNPSLWWDTTGFTTPTRFYQVFRIEVFGGLSSRRHPLLQLRLGFSLIACRGPFDCGWRSCGRQSLRADGGMGNLRMRNAGAARGHCGMGKRWASRLRPWAGAGHRCSAPK